METEKSSSFNEVKGISKKRCLLCKNINERYYSMQICKKSQITYPIGILWNMGQEYAREMMLKIAIMDDVIQVRIMDLQDMYEQFVYDCYSEDEEALDGGYIYDKINAMNIKSRKIVIFVVKIDNPTFQVNEQGKNQCIEARKIKKKIRAEYADKIDGYFFDNLIHMSDNEEEIQKTRCVVDKYSKYIVGDYIRRGYEGVLQDVDSNKIKSETIYTRILNRLKNNEEEER